MASGREGRFTPEMDNCSDEGWIREDEDAKENHLKTGN